MYPNGGVDEAVRIDQTDGCFKIGRAIAGTDSEYIFEADLASAFDDGRAVGVELGVIEVTVGIDEVQRGAELGRTIVAGANEFANG